jgi:hypothetical protein
MKYVYSTWIAIAAGICARIAWALAGPDVVLTDAAAYRGLAQSIASGHGYASSAGPSAYWVPGWPAWMALFYRAGASDRSVVLGNVLLGAITIGCVWAIARDVAGDRAGRVAAAVCALAPSLVLLPGVLLSENLALPLVALAAFALLRAKRTARALDWALFGLAVGGATLVRESSAAMLVAGGWLAVRESTRHEHASRARVTSTSTSTRTRAGTSTSTSTGTSTSTSTSTSTGTSTSTSTSTAVTALSSSSSTTAPTPPTPSATLSALPASATRTRVRSAASATQRAADGDLDHRK